MAENRVKQFREAQEMTQIMLAERAGVPFHTLTKIEQKSQLPKVDTAINIARALGARVEEIFEGRSPSVAAVSSQDNG